MSGQEITKIRFAAAKNGSRVCQVWIRETEEALSLARLDGGLPSSLQEMIPPGNHFTSVHFSNIPYLERLYISGRALG
ncbi:MAG: hypothetical protein WCG14_02130 [Chlamydiia bacterium]